jgi:hypothetical protein
MLWRTSKKPAALTAVLFFTICLYSQAQPEKLAISKFQVLNDFYANPALFGYWGRPAFGLVYNGAIPEKDFANNDIVGFYNQQFGGLGAGIELHLTNEGPRQTSSAKAGLSHGIAINAKNKLTFGAAFKYTYYYYDFEAVTFPDRIDPFYGFVRSIASEPYFSSTSVVGVDVGISLQGPKYLFSVYGENAAPILMQKNGQDAEYFSSDTYVHLPAILNGVFIYQFNLGKDFSLSPGAKVVYNLDAPEPWYSGLINLQWRNTIMLSYSYESRGFHQIMLGGRLKDKVSLGIGASTYDGIYTPYYSERVIYNLSILAQL